MANEWLILSNSVIPMYGHASFRRSIVCYYHYSEVHKYANIENLTAFRYPF
jgi:hypothetical protein